MKKIVLFAVLCLISCLVLAKSDRPADGEHNRTEPNACPEPGRRDPNAPRDRIQTKYFSLPLVIGERYRLGGDNSLVCIEKADGGGFIGKLTAGGKTVNIWCRGFGSSRPGSVTKYDRTLTVSGFASYNNVPVFVIQPWRPAKLAKK